MITVLEEKYKVSISELIGKYRKEQVSKSEK